MAELFANVLTAADGTITTLSAAISTTDGTSISTAGTFPAALRSGTCRIRIDNELLIATVNSSGVVTSVTRSAEGSTAATHASGAKVRHILTAGGLLSAQSGSLPTGGPGVLVREEEDGEATWVEVETADAADVSFTPAGAIAAANVQAAIEEVAAEKADASALTAHLNDTSDAHDASAISFAATGTLVATDVQAALAEAASEAASALATHGEDTTEIHGISDTTAIKGVVVWSEGGVPARPADFVSVEWIGPDDPSANALDGDTWVPTVAP